uniref:Photosystem I reaction center subunit XI n=1 Tax=Cyanophora paradoxa TaxID=2762 RepID=UPI001EF1612B|nr:Chain L, Photosystem I reaction center subunit XI [Cyanophora paradoxa]7DR1_L Chain L, Photosystem I reaction center subunit XI [Cyanophora paradoxa]7DR2_aL Chain aL, Photosystem I reaction center subunit XI [Cyanophora paradoxa]7DR2_bL Chain bL, Photosystem I reaction center subunit XI [Cyanophora paradoxa]7DR2_cL Chain cL, Photosystem I reaction center subunit XI [Cyanophora paradoxa]7DR2_dL Chain dL, Photosystem I reaction center subunit XI [Cyanophora paradoxa]
MAKDAVKPFYDDAFIGHLSTPISNSSAVNGLLANLPAYRKGLTPRLRGLEIGMAHGYFLTGPFVELGPLRNTDGGILYGSLSAVGLVVILTACLALYGKANFSGSSKSKDATLWESGEGWSDFVSGWLIGGAGSVGFAYLLLQYIL